ncbi:EAL domain-containing protein [Quadrisphaera sp. DSM 44207]|uniref:sensor domain-containing phosphodiesterase n=1 Tax=Quadrisphaera sp. DSM 44207 TaxID=1881057 RepID=UPI0015A27A58|nr:EAL domain-containing protein [Quadrisphaera sp. DSM 44207]
MGPAASTGALEDVLEGAAVTPVFQPLVDLTSGDVVGYEALARGPRGSRLELPDALFTAARRAGLVRELDWLCRRRAVDAARSVAFRHPLSLFVNAEPAGLAGPPGEDALAWRDMSDLRCYAEITERALGEHPAAVLRAADRVREQDWGIALDDIGADPASLALMPVLEPDVLKLDAALLAPGAGAGAAQVLHAVLAQAERTGAVVVAEGIETAEQHDLVRALGVGLGQGHLLGAPAELPGTLDFPTRALPMLPRLVDRAVPLTPFAIVSSSTGTRRLPGGAVRAVVEQLLDQAPRVDPAALVLTAGGPADAAGGTAGGTADGTAGGTALVTTSTSRGTTVLSAAVRPVVQWSGLERRADPPADPLLHDWDAVVLGPGFAAALVARPASSTPEPADEWHAVLTFDRDLVVRCAASLLARVP